MRATQRVLGLFLAAVALLPAAAPGEVVRLRDGSNMKGRLVGVDGDTLAFRLAVGALVKLSREQVLAIVFDDSLAAGALAAAAAGSPAEPAVTGTASIEVSFKDRDLSSKVSIDMKKEWDEHIAANHIVMEFLVDGRVVHSAVDTTMDKRIYKGHTTQFKNNVTLEDFKVDVPAGLRQCKLIVRNTGADTYPHDFDPEPLNLILAFDNVNVRPGEVVRLDVGIKKGKLGMGKARLYGVQ